jgi:hypothetical protein
MEKGIWMKKVKKTYEQRKKEEEIARKEWSEAEKHSDKSEETDGKEAL